MIELSTENMFFKGDNEKDKQSDLCVHGSVILRIDGDIIECGDDWCVSASALRFMRSVFNNHFSGEEQHMIPCCGHFMVPDENGETVFISGCSNGVDFDVIHENDNVIIKTDNKKYMLSLNEYINSVLDYVGQVEDFLSQNPKRIVTDDFDNQGYNAFKVEWFNLKEQIKKINDSVYTAQSISFNDYITLTENDILNISKDGISLRNGNYINFRECVYNFQKVNGTDDNCIGESDESGSNYSVVFYTSPLTTHVFFVSHGNLSALFAKSRFNDFKNKIKKYGYSICEE